MEDFKDTVQSRNCLEQAEVFKHYLLLLLLSQLMSLIILTCKKYLNVNFLFLLRIMMKCEILWQEFLLVWKCIHVMAWVSWISLFLAYLRYLGFFL